MRILFVADVHGADSILYKSLRAVVRFNADALILAGDLSGKNLVPLIDQGDGTFQVAQGSQVGQYPTSEIERVEDELARKGTYTLRCDVAEVKRLQRDPTEVEGRFTTAIVDRLDRWVDIIERELDLRRVRVFITPGNDDPLELDDALASYYARGIGSHSSGIDAFPTNEMVTLDYTNPTPWSTPREVVEKQLLQMIERRTSGLSDPERAIFNFHCPPYGTRLDRAPKLDDDLKPVTGPQGVEFEHVGSRSVRQAILAQAPMLALHGHVHEAAGEDWLGKTLCLNPGSEYWTGILHGYLIELGPDGRLVNHFRVEA